MRILLVSDEPDDASMGGAKVALKVQAGLGGLGHHCDVLLRPQLGARPRSQRMRLAAGPWLARKAVRRAEAAGGAYDIVDAASAEGWMLARGRAVVARSHGLEHRYYRELLQDAREGLLRKPWTHRAWYPLTRLPQVGWAVRRAAGVILLSQADRDEVVARGWAAAEKIEVIPHGVDRAQWARAPESDAPRGQGLLFCGWWTTSKGVAYLARAYGLLWARGVRPRLTLLGVGSAGAGWKAMEAGIRASFPAEAQALLQLVPRTSDEAAVYDAYRQHDALVCPSTFEGFGMVVIEALSQRLPVVCSQSAGAAELLHDGREALLVAPRQPAAMAAALEQLLANPGLRRQLGEAGHERTRALSWDAIAARTLALYERTLQR
ncbi:MAG TPA: glycosyltransferase family 4 protein [Terriglobales bacterium]|nr:glycosyltransferase family 4 protein [Terriglobales bacterium]